MLRVNESSRSQRLSRSCGLGGEKRSMGVFVIICGLRVVGSNGMVRRRWFERGHPSSRHPHRRMIAGNSNSLTLCLLVTTGRRVCVYRVGSQD